MAALRTHYQNLQVTENATDEVIKGAYRYLAQKWHPDKNPGDQAAEKVSKIINEAYHVLSDPERRQAHDRWIKAARADHKAGDTTHLSSGAPDPAGSPPVKPFVSALRWTLFLPAGYLIGFIMPGLILTFGGKLLGGSALLSGLAMYGAYCLGPLSVTTVGLSIAPRKTRVAKWLLLSPLILCAAFMTIGLLIALVSSNPTLPNSDFPKLPASWQIGIIVAATLHGIMWTVLKSPCPSADA